MRLCMINRAQRPEHEFHIDKIDRWDSLSFLALCVSSMSIISPLSVFDLVVPVDNTGVTAQYPWLFDYEAHRFSSISCDDLRRLFASSFADDDATPDMWRGRACFMCSSIFPGLIQLRDDYGVKLNYPRLKDAISYSGLTNLYNDDRLDNKSKGALIKYVHDLPGGLGSQNSQEAHGFLMMQFSSWLATMCELNHHPFVLLARQAICRHDTLNKIFSDNENQKILPFGVLRQWLLEAGVEDNAIILRATTAQRRESLQVDLNI